MDATITQKIFRSKVQTLGNHLLEVDLSNDALDSITLPPSRPSHPPCSGPLASLTCLHRDLPDQQSSLAMLTVTKNMMKNRFAAGFAARRRCLILELSPQDGMEIPDSLIHS